MAEMSVEVPVQPVNEVAQAREAVVKEVQAAGKVRSTELQDKRSIGERLKMMFLKEKRAEADSLRQHILARKADGISNDQKREAKEVKKTMAQLLEGVKQGVVEVKSEKSKLIIQKIDNHISLSDANAAPLYPLLEELLTKDVTVDDLERQFKSMAEYYAYSPQTYKDLSKAIVEVASEGKLGITREEAERRFEPVVPEVEDTEPSNKKEAHKDTKDKENEEDDGKELSIDALVEKIEGEYRQHVADSYRVIYQDLNPQERHLLFALQDPRLLKIYISKMQAEYDKKPGSAPNFGTYVSRELEQSIVFLVERAYARVDQQRPDKEFSEIERDDFMNSIESFKTRFLQQLRTISDTLNHNEVNSLFTDFGSFYKRTIDQEVNFKKLDITPPDELKDLSDEEKREYLHKFKTVMQESARSVPLFKEATISEVFTSIHNVVDVDLSLREYLHNVSVILRRPAGEGGFWAGIGGYAEKLRSVEQDAITRLPDSEVIMDVNRLLQKVMRSTFAQYDWMHQPRLFTEIYDLNRNTFEVQVQEEIQRLYPELSNPESRFRLQRAMSMGIGLGKGLYLNMIETAAWADPNQKVGPDGTSPTFNSYFYNDSAALEPLNPKHKFLRWQAEGVTKGPLVYLMTEGFDRKHTRNWDHSFFWNKAQEYSKSYVYGTDALHETNTGEKLFIDQMDNFGKVGSLLTRAGWRYEYALLGWTKMDSVGKVQVLDTWKAFENIGYEAVNWFQSNDDFKSLLKAENDNPKKQEFLKYLYTKYIDPNESTFNAYLDKMTTEAKKGFDETYKWQKDKFKDADKKAAQIRVDASYKLVGQALAGLLRQRAPSILVNVQRDRETKDGERMWHQLYRKVYQETIQADLKTQNDSKPAVERQSDDAIFKLSNELATEKMNTGMKDIMLVETLLRDETSKKMHAHLEAQQNSGKDQDLSTFKTDEYKLTMDVLEQRLTEIYQNQNPEGSKALTPDQIERIENAKKLFSGINVELDKNGGEYMKKFGERIRGKKFPFALAVDELDTSFFAFSNAGERPLARALGDTAGVEKDSYAHMNQLVEQFQSIATNGKHDFGTLVEHIHAAQHKIEGIHGHAAAKKLAHDLSAITISYFRQDRAAERIWTKLGRIGKTSSLAAEFTGVNRNCWEWNTADVDTFITLLEQSGTLPRKAYDLTDSHTKVIQKKSFLGITRRHIEHELEHNYSGDRLRDEFGANKKDIFKTMLINYGPLAVAAFGYMMVKKAIKEHTGKNKRSS
jgi:ethanolamine utilization protein EutQ (cupin superfamily)